MDNMDNCCTFSSQLCFCIVLSGFTLNMCCGLISEFLLIEFDELWKTATVLDKLSVDVDSIGCVFFNSLPLLPLNMDFILLLGWKCAFV